MEEDRIRTHIHTKEELIKAGIMPEAIDTAIDIEKWLRDHPKQTSTIYGHGGGMLGQVILSHGNIPFEQQRVLLKGKAQRLMEKYGEKIKDFMRPELRAALGMGDPQQGPSLK